MALKDIPGQSRAKRFLTRLIRSGHIPHAFLFSGMAGIGKEAVAREFAKILNCSDLQGEDCCDRCISCKKIDQGIHPDLLWLESEGAYIKIAQVRSLRDRSRFRPFEGNWRVTVIKDAQNLKEEAGNALLKLLEEPPKNNLFVLLTLEPQMLLSTLVSRCCHVRFQPLEDARIEEHLIRTYEVSPPLAKQLTRLAGGSLERVRWLMETDHIAYWKEILERVQGLSRLSMVDFFPLMARWAKDSEDLEQDLEYLKLWVRDLLLSRLVGEHHQVSDFDVNLGEMISDNIPVENLFRLYDEIEQSQQHLRRNANKQLTLEGVCLTIKDTLYGQGGRNSLPRRR